MKQFINFKCLGCQKITIHDVLHRTEIGTDSSVRIRCRNNAKCKCEAFTIAYPREIVNANIMTNLNGSSLTTDGDVPRPSPN